ncbi:MAG: response regulator [Candidatus Methylacidiphilales bacterium]
MMHLKPRFLLVDDDPLNNTLSRMYLARTFGNVEIKEFLIPEEALAHMDQDFTNNQSEGIVTLFLDINMPTLSGWEFLEKFNCFDESLKKQYHIYMLTSSIDPADIKRAKLNPLVLDFIEKPINKEILTKIFGEIIKY